MDITQSGLSRKEVLLCLVTAAFGFISIFLVAAMLPDWGVFIVIFVIVPAMLVAILKIPSVGGKG